MKTTSSKTTVKPGSEAKTIGIILLVVSLMILIYPLAMNILKERGIINISNYSSSTEGTVTQTVEDSDRHTETFIIAYEVDGKAYTLDKSVYPTSGQETLSIGDKETVLYDPSNPKASTLNVEVPVENTEVRQASAGFFGFFGVAFLTFSLYTAKQSRKTSQN